MKAVFENHDISNTVPPEVSLCVFRVLQEALHNAAKHKKARELEVQLWGTWGELRLLVMDLGLVFRPKGQIGRNAEVRDVSNNRRYKTRSSHAFSRRSGNCVAQDRPRFPCDRSRLPRPRILAAEHAGIPLSHDRECARSHTDSVGRRAHTANGPGVNNRSWWIAVERQVAADSFAPPLARYFVSALVTPLREPAIRTQKRSREGSESPNYFLRFSFDDDIHHVLTSGD